MNVKSTLLLVVPVIPISDYFYEKSMFSIFVN